MSDEFDDIEDDFVIDHPDYEVVSPHERRRIVERDDKMLTPAEVKFIESYIATGKIGESKKAAGLPPGSNVHKRLHVRNRIEELFDDAIAESGITPDKVLHELGRIAFANIDDFVDEEYRVIRSKPSRGRMAAVQSVKVDTIAYADDDKPPVERVELKMYDKLKALNMLANHFNLFTDVKITLDISERLQRAEQRAKTLGLE